jgi:hypothetical protein
MHLPLLATTIERVAKALAATALLALLCAGCSARRQVRNAAPEAGAVRSYLGAFEDIQKAALSALSESGLLVSEERWVDRRRWSILGSAPGRAARIVVEDHPSECRVWVLDLRQGTVLEDLHDRIAGILGHERRPEPSPAVGSSEKEERYRSPLSACFNRVSLACRDRGYEILRQDAADPALRTIAAEKPPSLRLFVALYRVSEEMTRVVVDVRGGPPDENKAEASAVHAELLKELLPDR